MQAKSVGTAALAALAVLGIAGAQAGPAATTVTFAVMRNGAQIGTNSIRIGHDGADTTVAMVTHVKVGFAFVTFYRFDQTETERWSDGRLVAMDSTTDENGDVHRASAAARDGAIVVQCNGKTNRTPSTTIPFNLWDKALVDQSVALDTRDGGLDQVKVTDRGEGEILVEGRPRRAHHYEVVTTFPQDVWYDDGGRLLQVELKAVDGSIIRYQLT